MHPECFDSWTMVITNPRSRRSLIGAVASLAAVSGLLSLGARDAAACKNPGAKCKKNKQCCNGRCKGKKGKKRCRCFKVGTACPPAASASCCGAMDCGYNACVDGSTCCLPAGAVGCTSDCDCCQGVPAVCGGSPFSPFCCRESGEGCNNDDDCCSLNCLPGLTCL